MTDSLAQRNADFRLLLESLNPDQRRAVDQTEGPVLVIAGPGTGKTHVLSARIGKILLDTDTRPQNILCLTFTDAGVNAMRQRLLGMIGPEAHRVPIYTFHAFCNRIIQENLEFFGRADLEPITDLERIELVRHLLDRLTPEHPLREGRKSVYFYEKHLRDLFSTMKKEGWTPGHVLKSISTFLNELPENPDFVYQKTTKYGKKGAPKTSKVQDAQEKMSRLAAAADLYPKYLNAMQRAGRYEYEDMLLWVLRAFDRHENLLRTYQERFLYFLVDEYQDTNGAQNSLLKLLLDYWPNPNVFIVGDDDQSIYEFQGARLQNLLEFYEHHRDKLLTVVLHENYRSSQNILDAAAGLIQHNTLRAINALGDQELNKNLQAQTTEKQIPVLRVYENRLHETADIVRQIEALLQNGESPSEIAVLYARHKQAGRLMAMLEKKSISYVTKRPVNILDLPVIQQFRELLRYLNEEITKPFSGDHRLFRLLHARWWGVESLDLARAHPSPGPSPRGEGGLRSRNVGDGGGPGSGLSTDLTNVGRDEKDRQESFDQSSEAGDIDNYRNLGQGSELPNISLNQAPLPPAGGAGGGVWRRTLNNFFLLQSLHLSDPQKLYAIAQKLEGWIADTPNLPLPALIERLYSQSGLLAWSLAEADKVWYLQVLSTLLAFVNAEAERNPRFSLDRLLALLDSMDDNKLALEIQQTVQAREGVQLLTAHSAKGLEFRHVFMLDCTDDFWEPSARSGASRFTLPDTLTLSGEEDALEARRRLFYVAMTRAKRHLQISYSRFGLDGKLLKQACFVDETGLSKTEAILPPGLALEAQAILLQEAPKPVITLPESALLDNLLLRFTLSITALNRFLRCPLAFYYQDLLHIPETSSEAAAFGQVIHEIMCRFFLKMKADKKQEFPGEESLVRMFVTEMELHRGLFSTQSYAQRLSIGRSFLRQYHATQVPYWRRRAVVERRIDRAEFEGIPLTGVLDKIEWLENNTVRIVDYKTGVPDPKKVAAPSDTQPHGGDFWRQLAFYKILLEAARQIPEPVGSGMIAWLEPDKKGAIPTSEIRFSVEEVHFMENLIRDTYGKIIRREFTEGCGLEDCVWCRMHRDNKVAGVLFNGEEGLDDES